MARKKGRNPDNYGGIQTLKSGRIRWVGRDSGRRRPGPSVPPETPNARDVAKAEYFAMLRKERDEADLKARETSALSWYLYALYVKGGVLEKEGYARDSLELGRTVLDRYVTPDPLGDLDLAMVTRRHLVDWRNRLPGKPRTVARYFSVVRAALQRATDEERIPANPAVGIKMPRAEEPEIRVLKDVAQAAFLAAVKEPPSEARLAALAELRKTRPTLAGSAREKAGRVLDPGTRRRTYEACVLMLHGLRRAEACGLRHEAYDPANGGVRIVRQRKASGEVSERTKTGKERWVPLDPEAQAILARRRTKDARGEAARVEVPLSPRQLERDMDAQLALTPYAGIDPHDLRHSTVHSLKKAQDVRTAADILGHSPAVLLGVYDRSDEEDRRRAFDRARAGLGATGGATDGASG